MIILKQKKGYQYKVAQSVDGLYVVNETNSWPITIYGAGLWSCEHERLPAYVRKWVAQIIRGL